MRRRPPAAALCTLCALALAAPPAAAAPGDTPPRAPVPASMLAPGGGWRTLPSLTVGDTVGEDEEAYTPIGVFDGIGAYAGKTSATAEVVVSHEVRPDAGYAYELANGTSLTGARISNLSVDTTTKQVTAGRLAYDTMYDRTGAEVTQAQQVNEMADDAEGADSLGINRFCSGRSVAAGELGFTDDIYFANEETSAVYGHPHGGSVWALDVDGSELWAVPELGRGTWENVTPLAPPGEDQVALLMGDDFAPTAAYLWIGEKDTSDGAGFLARNGLSDGTLYAWAGEEKRSPLDWTGVGSSDTGEFVEVTTRDTDQAGRPGYDDQGYLDDPLLRTQALGGGAVETTTALQGDLDELYGEGTFAVGDLGALGATAFSRPEDVHEDPADPASAVLASTGRGSLYPNDDLGEVYRFDTDLAADGGPVATVTVIADSDGSPAGEPVTGLRSPDNLTWSPNGTVYVQEDPASQLRGEDADFAGTVPSVWALDPESPYALERIASVDYDVIRPEGATYPEDGPSEDPWETSGVLDVSDLFVTQPDETLLVLDVQAHGVEDGPVAELDLVESAQLVFLSDADAFGDISSSVHADAIRVLASAGVALGSDGQFLPTRSITRGQVASFIARAGLLEPRGDASTFTDTESSVHAEAISALVDAGVAQGYGDGTFGPARDVTRGQLASMLARVLELDTDAAGADCFPDLGASVHAGAVCALADAGIALGLGDGTFAPGRSIDRAQTAALVARTYGYVSTD